MKYSIIIPSRTLSNLESCLQAIRRNKITARVFVIWDDPGGRPVESLTKLGRDVEVLQGKKPFIFARAVNQGIAAAGEDDVILLNDDALLITMGGFDLLGYAADQNPEYGAISALIMGMAAAPDQVANITKMSAGSAAKGRMTVDCLHHMLAFMAVYIRRATLETLGSFDERFTAYGYDDDDYCKRIKEAGLRLGVEYSCVVEHGSLPSTYRGQSQPAGLDRLAENRAKFMEKWGAMK